MSGSAKKVNTVNYFTIPPPPVDEYYYEENSYIVNEQTGVLDKTPKAPIRINVSKVKEIKFKIMVTTIERVNMFYMGIITATTFSIGVTMVIEMIRVGPIFPHRIGKFLLRVGEVVRRKLKIFYKR